MFDTFMSNMYKSCIVYKERKILPLQNSFKDVRREQRENKKGTKREQRGNRDGKEREHRRNKEGIREVILEVIDIFFKNI